MGHKPIDLAALESWVGRSETRCDTITPLPVSGLAATLGKGGEQATVGVPLPPLWHWLYFLTFPASPELDVDGHPHRGGFLPPVTLPRRMWAGSRVTFHQSLCIGDSVERLSRIDAVEYKEGRSGELVFVTVQHEITRDGARVISETQQLVYREQSTNESAPARQARTVGKPQWSRTLHPDAVMLFRYSALTFNSHRIHYDREYAVHEEGYGGLVVQGPLTATLLLDALLTELPGVAVTSFRFRGIRPLLAGGTVSLQGAVNDAQAELWALDGDNNVVMLAEATLS